MQVNFLKETMEILQKHGIDPMLDEVFVTTNCYKMDAYTTSEDKRIWMTWDEFLIKADFEYNNGFGGVEIPLEMQIICPTRNAWLERHEYDGCEWWEYKEPPVLPKTHQVFDIQREYD